MHIQLFMQAFSQERHNRGLVAAPLLSGVLFRDFSNSFSSHCLQQIFTVSALDNPYRVILSGKNENEEPVLCCAFMVASTARLPVG